MSLILSTALNHVVSFLKLLISSLSLSAILCFLRLRLADLSSSIKEEQDPRKHEFLSEYRLQYGYPQSSIQFDEFRATEFPQLKGNVYLDHAGATLYSRQQICSSLEDLCTNLYGNPHSQSGSSNISSNVVSKAREEVLAFFNASNKDYKCVFTSGATSSLKLVGEWFPWTSNSHYWYTTENHNSVLGIREYALPLGASVCAVDIEDFTEPYNLQRRACQRRFNPLPKCHGNEGPIYNLFAFPMDCNFSGRKFDLNLVKFIQEGQHAQNLSGKWLVLLDAAKGCGTSRLDLSKYPADFVAVSFYKIFGFPTGLGALLVRTESAKLLEKKYFGGGAVAASVADTDYFQRRENIEQWLEDGTVSFLAVAALQKGFRIIKKLGISNIAMHTGCLAKFTAHQLLKMKHVNGNNVCVVYGCHSSSTCEKSYWGENCDQGPVVAFNLKRSDGSWVGYREVEKLATLCGIHLRTGCFCNPGACSIHLGLSESEIRANHEAGHVCWDDHDIIHGKPTGAIRVSFGYMSAVDDSLTFLQFIAKYFVDDFTSSSLTKEPLKFAVTSSDEQPDICLKSIKLYPIKSCAGFSVDSWPLGNSGLLYDREWVVMSASGAALTQKKCPLMCFITTRIDMSLNKLIVSSPRMKSSLEISIKEASGENDDVEFKLCGESSTGKSYDDKVTKWFTEALDTPCTLVRKRPKSRQIRSKECVVANSCKAERELSFANEGQFLLVSLASVQDLNQHLICSGKNIEVNAMRFRPNFVISGNSAFEEHQWKSIFIGSHKFDVTGGCNRCEMINIDQTTGRTKEGCNPLLTLASYRRIGGKILFGILLAQDESSLFSDEADKIIKVGSKVSPKTTA